MSHLRSWVSVCLLLGIVPCVQGPVVAQEPAEETPTEVYVPPAGTIYYWYDDNNSLHATDQLQTIPKAHRSAALKRAGVLPDGTDTSYGTGSQSGGTVAPPVKAQKKIIEAPEKGEQYWRDLIAEETRIKNKSARELVDVEAEMIHQMAVHPPGFHAKLAELDGKKKALEAAIIKATFELEEGIPEKARKAGAQPGWLR